MSPERLEVAENADDAAWDAWTDLSPQGTVFSKSAFMRSLGAPFRRLVVTSAGRAVALLPLMEDGEGNTVRFPFTPYQGILFLPDARAQPRQRVVNEFRITQAIIETLTTRYSRIALALSWTFADIRPFLWHNYGVTGAPRFLSEARYTAVLQLGALDPARYAAEVRASRRQELKKAAALAVREEAGVDEFLSIYQLTFARQGILLDRNRLELVRNIAECALSQGYGRLSSCRTAEGVAAMSLFLYDRKRAYYLFAANDPAQRHTGASTRLMVDNIFEAKRRGLAELDFVGVNSPARGDFKLSFNPELRLYFELTLASAGQQPAP
jgi:hypothetical protein